MRNPINSIHVQVLEMDNLNRQLEELILTMHTRKVSKTKKKLENVISKYKHSLEIQMSSEKILGSLVNDILDYAQISSGKFRKLFSRFNIRECVLEIVLVLQFKAKKLGVIINTNFVNFCDPSIPMIQNYVTDSQLMVVLDQQRLK